MVSKTLAKLYAKFLLRDVPNGKEIVERFFDIYWEARKLREDLIKLTENEIERKYALAAKSRVMFPLALQTASIAMANGVSDESLIDIVANQMFAYGEATIGDDFHDEVLLPYYFMKMELRNSKEIYETITNPNKLRQIAKEIGGIKGLHPLELLNASISQAEIYKRKMSKSFPYAYQTYLNARDELYKIQANSLFISYLLAKNDLERIRKELSGDYVKNVVKLGDKLGLIGRENAAVVFQATRPETIPEEKAKEIEDGLRLFYHGCTLLKQFTEDDSLKLREDVEKRVDNLWLLLALENQEEISETCVKLYLNSNPRITREVLSPCVDEIRKGYEKLKSLGYDLRDLRLAVNLVKTQAKRDMKKFENEYKVSLDKEWLSNLKNLAT
jgi:hypothetical protein